MFKYLFLSRLYAAMSLVLMLCATAAHGAALKVTYPVNETAGDTRFNDLMEILQTALEKTTSEFGPFELEASKQKMNEERYLAELQKGQVINIAWSSTSTEKEAALLPLRIPLRKGILGYRVALISKENQAKIDQVKSLADQIGRAHV